MWAEIHVFRGQMYVTQVWGSTGVRVDDDARDARLGEVIVEQLSRPTVRSRPGERSAWQASMHICSTAAPGASKNCPTARSG